MKPEEFTATITERLRQKGGDFRRADLRALAASPPAPLTGGPYTEERAEWFAERIRAIVAQAEAEYTHRRELFGWLAILAGAMVFLSLGVGADVALRYNPSLHGTVLEVGVGAAIIGLGLAVGALVMAALSASRLAWLALNRMRRRT